MPATPESKVKTFVRKALADEGVWYFSPAANGYGRSGIPDIIACVNGCFLAIECKAGKGRTTALQERELKLIREVGKGHALVVSDDPESQRTLLETIALLKMHFT
jgi:Holliday junction resolvase